MLKSVNFVSGQLLSILLGMDKGISAWKTDIGSRFAIRMNRRSVSEDPGGVGWTQGDGDYVRTAHKDRISGKDRIWGE